MFLALQKQDRGSRVTQNELDCKWKYHFICLSIHHLKYAFYIWFQCWRTWTFQFKGFCHKKMSFNQVSTKYLCYIWDCPLFDNRLSGSAPPVWKTPAKSHFSNVLLAWMNFIQWSLSRTEQPDRKYTGNIWYFIVLYVRIENINF